MIRSATVLRATLMLVIGAAPFSALASADAAATAPPASAQTVVPVIRSPLIALLMKPVTLRGTLDTKPVAMHLRAKVPADEGIEGDYVLGDGVRKILLAGESENKKLSLEESENGIDISGTWEGVLDDRTLRGIWTSADGDTVKPFALVVVPSPSMRTKNAAKIKGHSRYATGHHAHLP